MADLSSYQTANPQNDHPYRLQLFVAGASYHSVQAITNLKQICETYLAGRYQLEIIDVYQHKQLTQQEQIIALPLLIKRSPLPERKLVGDMSDVERVLLGLGLTHPPA